MSRIRGQHNPLCATYSTGTLKASVVEVSVRKDLTIHQFEHTKLIGQHITFGINPIPVEVCCGTIIAAQVEAVVFDRLHQCPQTQQVSITIKVVGVDFFTSTNAGIDLLLNLLCFLISYKGGSGCHLTGKLTDFLYIGKRRLTMSNVCIRFDKLHQVVIMPHRTVRVCHSITKIAFSIVTSVRSNDDLLINNVGELISQQVGLILIRSTETDEVCLIDGAQARQIIKASMKDLCNVAIIELINLLMTVSNTNLLFVEYCFSANEKSISGRISSPYNCGGTVHLHRQGARGHEPIQHGEVPRQDGVFSVFQVGVLHVGSIGCLGVLWRFGGHLTKWHRLSRFAPHEVL